MKYLKLISFSISICFILACNSNKPLTISNQSKIKEQGVIANITRDPLDSFTVHLSVENHSNESIVMGARLESGYHEIVIHYPNGTILNLSYGLTSRSTVVKPGEIYNFSPWMVGEQIIYNRIFKSFDKKKSPDGIYHITWKNDRLGFSTSYDYYFDFDIVTEKL